MDRLSQQFKKCDFIFDVLDSGKLAGAIGCWGVYGEASNQSPILRRHRTDELDYMARDTDRVKIQNEPGQIQL